MRKSVFYRLAVLLMVALVMTGFTGCRTILSAVWREDGLSHTIADPQNVFEEIWNLVLTEEYTSSATVLTSATENASKDFDHGFMFVSIQIPACDMYISWNIEGETLQFTFPQGEGYSNYITYIYNHEEKTLYGNQDLACLTDSFLTDYFVWCEKDPDFQSGYSADAMGDFTFQLNEPL